MNSPIAKIGIYVDQIRQTELHFVRSRRDKETNNKAMFNFIFELLGLRTAAACKVRIVSLECCPRAL